MARICIYDGDLRHEVSEDEVRKFRLILQDLIALTPTLCLENLSYDLKLEYKFNRYCIRVEELHHFNLLPGAKPKFLGRPHVDNDQTNPNNPGADKIQTN